eukprot:SAG22_NODE_337_length_12043_cov_58.339556_6_plen_96_part_00
MAVMGRGAPGQAVLKPPIMTRMGRAAPGPAAGAHARAQAALAMVPLAACAAAAAGGGDAGARPLAGQAHGGASRRQGAHPTRAPLAHAHAGLRLR